MERCLQLYFTFMGLMAGHFSTITWLHITWFIITMYHWPWGDITVSDDFTLESKNYHLNKFAFYINVWKDFGKSKIDNLIFLWGVRLCMLVSVWYMCIYVWYVCLLISICACAHICDICGVCVCVWCVYMCVPMYDVCFVCPWVYYTHVWCVLLFMCLCPSV